MKEITKKYSNGEVTIVWKPDKCIHSGICFRGLGEVFDPRKLNNAKDRGSGKEVSFNGVELLLIRRIQTDIDITQQVEQSRLLSLALFYKVKNLLSSFRK